MANYTSTHTGATIDASVTIISSSGVTQSDLVKLNAVTSSAVELNLLDGVTASTAELNILDGATLSVTELNYLDGADSSITTLSLPDNTTISTFGASLVDDADAASARTTLGVDVAGTDNSTDVTLVTTSHDYLSLSGQAITLGQIDISDDTNLVGGDGLALTGDTLSVNVDDSSIEINSDTLRVKASGVTNAMLVNSSLSYGGVSVALGSSDATPAFDLSDATSLPIVAGTTGTLSVARGGTGATTASGARTNLNVDVAGTDNSTDVTLVTTSHDYLSLSGQAVTLGQIDISDDTNLVGGTGITLTGDTLSTTDSEIVHDNLSGFVANEHIDHSGVSITAGAGLTGGGDITATRDIAVGAGTGVTVNADDIAIGQDVATSADVEFNSVTADIIGDIRGATKFQAKADVALNIGDAVYISGISGNTPTVDIADSNDAAKMPSFGLAASSVSINASVEIITFGTLAGLNTSAFSVGDVLYVSTNGTSGNTLTATPPTGESSLIQNIGKVQRSHASAGSIKVGGAGRSNATPNLDDGDIFIGNGSNQAVTAALNTKIQDYLNTGVNLPSPTFSGDIEFSDASTPQLKIEDTTNNVVLDLRATDTLAAIGTTTDSPLHLKQNGAFQLSINSTQIILNAAGEDRDTIIKDDSGTSVFKVNAGTSTTEIGTLSVTGNSVLAGDLQVNGTTTTVNQTNLDVSDNIIGLNRGAASNANDSGLIIERGSTGDNVFIGWDESLDRIRFATTASDASSTGDLSLTNANIHAGRLYADVSGDVTGNADTATTLATARNFSLTGDVTAGAVSFDGSGNVALSTTIAANSVALGTDTTGNYMSDLTEGTGIDISHTPGEGSNGTITLDLTEVGFGGGANRLITDDGDGTVSTEANLTFNGTYLDFNDSRIRHNNATFGTYDWENYQQDDGTLIWAINGTGGAEVTLSADGADYNTTFLQLGNKIKFATNGNSYINTSNNVGIGTGSPGSKLHIRNNSAADQLRLGRVDDDSYLSVGAGANNAVYNMVTGGTIAHQFQEDGDAKMTIQTNGNVGIGTVSPGDKLDVNGGITTNYGVAFTNGNTNFLQYNNSGEDVLYLRDTTNGAMLLTYGTGRTTIHKNARFDSQVEFEDTNAVINRVSNDLEIRTYGGYDINLMPAGNVGIGTAAPGYKLDVAGQGKVTNGWLVDNGTTAGFFTTDSDNVNFGASTSGKGLKLYSANAEAMRINSSGNVGIGTAILDAGAKLNVVSGSSAYTAQFSRHDADDGLFLHSEAEATHYNWLISTQDNVDKGFEITPSTGVGNRTFSTPAFVIKADTGNVGIGTTSPAFGLQIDGAQFSGDAFKITRGTSAFTILNANNDYGVLGMESDHDLQIRTNGNTRLTIDNQGNLKFADNGTNPSSVTNTAFLFNDGGELKVLDELGNTTTISPHNFSLIPDGASEERAWGYYSEKDIVDDEGNVTATQKVNVDMMKLARLVEELTGEKLVYTEED